MEAVCTGLGHSLTMLDLANNPQLTDAAVYFVARSCPLLNQLVLKGCTALTDRSLDDIGACLKLLTRVVLFGLMHITDEALTRLVTRCKHMQVLMVGFDFKVTRQVGFGFVRRHRVGPKRMHLATGRERDWEKERESARRGVLFAGTVRKSTR